jgi:hypothetical protein
MGPPPSGKEGLVFTTRKQAPGSLALRRRLAPATAALLLLALAPTTARAYDIPPHLPRYDLDIKVDVDGHQVTVVERVKWTNTHLRPTDKLVFNVASAYTVDTDQVGLLAKTLEILRLAPSDALDFGPSPFQLGEVILRESPHPNVKPGPLAARQVRFQQDNKTALEIDLGEPVCQGESVTVELTFTLRLPQKQGRWG